MMEKNESIESIVAEMRSYPTGLRLDECQEFCDRVEAAIERDRTSRHSIKIPIEVVPELAGNAAAMREALEGMCKASQDVFRSFARETFAGERRLDSLGVAFDKAKAALSAPARNCDRPECATSKDAQDVWRKEDGGKTPYYEWILAPAAEREGECDGQ